MYSCTTCTVKINETVHHRRASEKYHQDPLPSPVRSRGSPDRHTSPPTKDVCSRKLTEEAS